MKTAFVLAGGGSFAAIQAGMRRELLAHGVYPDLVVGSSVGALNGAYLASDQTTSGVSRLERSAPEPAPEPGALRPHIDEESSQSLRP